MYVNCINVIKPHSNIMHKWKWKIKADRRKVASGMKKVSRKRRRANEWVGGEESGEETNTNKSKIRLLPLVVFIDVQAITPTAEPVPIHILANTHTRKTHEKLISARYKLVSVCTIWLIKNYLECIDMPMILVAFIVVYHTQIS